MKEKCFPRTQFSFSSSSSWFCIENFSNFSLMRLQAFPKKVLSIFSRRNFPSFCVLHTKKKKHFSLWFGRGKFEFVVENQKRKKEKSKFFAQNIFVNNLCFDFFENWKFFVFREIFGVCEQKKSCRFYCWAWKKFSRQRKTEKLKSFLLPQNVINFHVENCRF